MAKRQGKRTSPQAPLPLSSEAAATSRLSPTDRLIEAKAAHVDALDRERLELIVEIRRLREANELLQATLDQLRPQLARSEAELIGLRGNSLVASLFTLVGGAAVSTAGYFKALASPILWVGIAVLVCGLVIMAIGSRGDRRDH